MTAPMSSFRKAELRMLADALEERLRARRECLRTLVMEDRSPESIVAAGLAEALDEIDRLEVALKECDDERKALLSMGSHILGVSGGSP